MKTISFITQLTVVASLIGIYQLPLIESSLQKHDIYIPLNEHFPWAMQAQQEVENFKITLTSINDIEHINDEAVQTPVIEKFNETIVKQSPTETIIPPKVLCKEKCKVLMIGDSMMGDLALALQRQVKKEHSDWQIIIANKVSSGLSHQIYYDWPATATQLVKKHNPDYTVLLLGTNDAQNMSMGGKGVSFGKEPWVVEYTLRSQKMAQIMSNSGSSWVWIELPVVREKGFNNRLQVIRTIHQEVSEKHWLKTDSIFGGLTSTDKVTSTNLRAGDGIHFNAHGANKLAQYVWSHLQTVSNYSQTLP